MDSSSPFSSPQQFPCDCDPIEDSPASDSPNMRSLYLLSHNRNIQIFSSPPTTLVLFSPLPLKISHIRINNKQNEPEIPTQRRPIILRHNPHCPARRGGLLGHSGRNPVPHHPPLSDSEEIRAHILLFQFVLLFQIPLKIRIHSVQQQKEGVFVQGGSGGVGGVGEEARQGVSYLGKYMFQSDFFSKYQPIKKVGKGGFSTVYLIKHKVTGEKYAAKVFSKGGLEKYKNGKECLLNEIVLMRTCEHRYVLKLIEIYEEDSAYYAVLELVEGGDLMMKMKKENRMKEEEVKTIFRQMLKGMKHIHDKQIIHRDLKPSNIFFKNDGHLVIGDFGLATSLLEGDYLIGKCGTPGYAAPEMFKLKDKKGLSTSVDVFSLGVILYEMLSGNSLFDSNDYNQVMELNKQGIFKLSGISEQAAQLLQKILDLNPSKRLTIPEILKSQYMHQQKLVSNASLDQENMPPAISSKTKIKKSSIDQQTQPLLNPLISHN